MASFKAAQFTTLPQESLEEYTKALETEKARAEEAERMYEVLKKIHEDCTEEFRVTQNQTQRFFADSEQKLQKADETMRELRRTIVDQSREISELKPNLLTAQKQEVLRLSVQTELEKKYQMRLRSLQEENVSLKSKIAGLIFEKDALKSDLESQTSEFKRAKKEFEMKFDRKIEDSKREKDSAAAIAPVVDLQRFRQIQRDNHQLEIRVKAQQTEMETMRVTESRRTDEAHANFKTQSQKIAEQAIKLENFKAELEVQRRHTETLRTRISELTSENSQLSQRIDILNDEKLTAETDRESLLQRHQIELGNERAKAVTEKTALQKEANFLLTEVEKLKGEVDSVKQALDLQRSTVAAKEHETQMKLNQMAQKNIAEISLIEQQKHEVELKLASTEIRISTFEKDFQTKNEKFNDELRRSHLQNSNLQKELEIAKNAVGEYQRMEIEFEKLKKDHASLQEELRGLLGQISVTEKTFESLQNEKRNLEKEIFDLKNRQKNEEIQFGKILEANQAKLETMQKSWNEKRNSYAVFLKRQEEKIQKNRTKFSDLSEKRKILKKKQKNFKKKIKSIVAELIRELKTKAALLDLAKDSVSQADYKNVTDELAQLKQKMARLKSIAVPGEAVVATAQPNLNRIESAKIAASQHFDRIIDGKVSQSHLTSATNKDFQELLGKLKQMGLTEESDGQDSSEASDAESVASDESEKFSPIPSIGL